MNLKKPKDVVNDCIELVRYSFGVKDEF